ncbi:unannotated protein [freshwater metagenome]|uniref:Unannotated protein n=1 Tax=freshwater metagenome TaxID=449393 RepID=A0A6J6W527_9ZZZZ
MSTARATSTIGIKATQERELLSRVALSASATETSCEEEMLILLRDQSLLAAWKFRAIRSAVG